MSLIIVAAGESSKVEVAASVEPDFAVRASTKSGFGPTAGVAEGVGQGPGLGLKSFTVTELEDEAGATSEEDGAQVVGLESGPSPAAATAVGAEDPADHSSQVEEAPAGLS